MSGLVTTGLALATALIIPPLARASMRVERVEINGFDVRLVDTGRANEFGFAVAVPFGAADDEPSKFGRAHLFEHMFLRGSARFPGAYALEEAKSRYDFTIKASTGLARTVFYGYGPDEHGLDAMAMLLAGLEGLELNEIAFANEKRTVIEEIVRSAPNRPDRARTALPFAVLPAPGHPARGFFQGDARTLGALTTADLRSLHRAIYHAGHVRLAVFANFRGGRWSPADVTARLRDVLPARAPAAPPAPPVARAPAFSHEMVMDLAQARARGRLILPVRNPRDLPAVRAFANTFDHGHAGGLVPRGRREFGWITSAVTRLQRVGPEHFVFLDFEMTESGYARRDQVAAWILASLAAARADEYDDAAIAEVRRDLTHYYRRLEENLPSLAKTFGGWLAGNSYEEHLALKWEAIVDAMTPALVRVGARALDLERKVIVFSGPAPAGAIASDVHTRVAFAVKPWTEPILGIPAVSPRDARAVAIDLVDGPPRESDYLPPGREVRREGGGVILRWTDESWSDRTVRLRFDLKPLPRPDRFALRAFARTFLEAHADEIAAFESRGVSLTLVADGDAIEVTAGGDRGLEVAALEWLFSRLSHHRPSPAALGRSLAAAERAGDRDEEGFAGHVAARLARRLLAPWRARAAVDPGGAAAPRGDVSVPDEAWRRGTRASRKTYVVAGRVTESEMRAVVALARAFSPGEEPVERIAPLRPVSRLEFDEPWRDPARNGVGLARVHAGAESADVMASATLPVVARLVRGMVFPRARPFGYVQSVFVTTVSARDYVMFSGQTGAAEHAPEVRRAWDEEVARFVDGRVDPARLEAARARAHDLHRYSPATSREAAAWMLADHRAHGNPFRRDHAADALARARPGDFFNSAARHLGDAANALTVIKGVGSPGDCADLLERRRRTRRALVRFE